MKRIPRGFIFRTFFSCSEYPSFCSESPTLPLTRSSMQYHCIMILVHRPFFSVRTGLSGLSFAEVTASRNACTEAAASIARLVQIYRRLYTLRRINVQTVHLIFTATLIHVVNACGSLDPDRSDKAWKDLEVCCQALSEIGLAYKNAARAVEVVMCIKNELLKRTRAKTKRQNPLTGGPENMPLSTKKRRFTNAEPRVFPGETVSGEQSSAATTNSSSVDTHDPSALEEFAYDDSTLDSLFWTGFTTLELPHLALEDT